MKSGRNNHEPDLGFRESEAAPTVSEQLIEHGLFAVPRGGGTPKLLAEGRFSRAIAAPDGTVFAQRSDDSAVLRIPPDAPAEVVCPTCDPGNWCNDHTCEACNTVEHCGAECATCQGETLRKCVWHVRKEIFIWSDGPKVRQVEFLLTFVAYRIIFGWYRILCNLA